MLYTSGDEPSYIIGGTRVEARASVWHANAELGNVVVQVCLEMLKESQGLPDTVVMGAGCKAW